MKPQFAAQMYTVREAAKEDLENALRRVADLGFDGVELAGLFGLTASQVAQTLQSLNLKCMSAHIPLTDLQNNLSRELEIYKELGANFLVCPWLPPELRGNKSDYKRLAQQLNQIGEQCRENGIQLCYHHHDFELTRFDGKYGLDILLEESDPANVQLEADTYWLKYVDQSPAAYISKWSGRVPLLHLKDMTPSTPPTFTEVGNGILDWPKILDAAQTSQIQWYIIEQDICPGDPFDSLKLGLDNVKQLI